MDRKAKRGVQYPLPPNVNFLKNCEGFLKRQFMLVNLSVSPDTRPSKQMRS